MRPSLGFCVRPTKFGRAAIGFVSVIEDDSNCDSHSNPTQIRTQTDVLGCNFRPLPATEKFDTIGNLVSKPWQATRHLWRRLSPPKRTMKS